MMTAVNSAEKFFSDDKDRAFEAKVRSFTLFVLSPEPSSVDDE